MAALEIIKFALPKSIVSDVNGYEFFSGLNLRTYNLRDQIIVIDFLSNDWFEANLCSPFGALVEDLRGRGNRVMLHGLQESAEGIFQNNGFYTLINDGFVKKNSMLHTIEFNKFKLQDTNIFQAYVYDQLLSHQHLPEMSTMLKAKINRSILEIFNNAHIHGGCQIVYTCGEYNSRERKLKFTLSDMGVTIRKNVNNHFALGNKLSGKACINWAVQERNTTKKGKIPGGLGLSLIREFLKLNGGRIQIVSSSGYWEENRGMVLAKELVNRFLGTIVNLEFNLDDKKSYYLKSEVNSTNVL